MDFALFDRSIHIHPFIWNPLVLGAAIFTGLILNNILVRITRYYNKVETYSFFKSSVIHLAKPLNLILPLVVFNLMMPLLTMGKKPMAFVSKTLEIGMIISVAYILISVIRIAQDYVLHVYRLDKEDNLQERKITTQLQFIRKFLVAFIILLTVAAVLFSFENMRKIGAGLLTSVGIGGIIIGFAAQKSLANLFAGFQLAFTQPIRIDDVLIVENEWGRVEEITLTYVVVAIWDQRRLVLPITYFVEKPFQNWTRKSAELLGTVFLYVDHTIPVAELRPEFERLLNASPLWDKRAQVIQVTDVKESTIELRLLMSARNAPQAFDLRCYIRENMITFIQKNYPGSLPVTRNRVTQLNPVA
ncbi:MAG: mechanosensitive ion channel [Mucilaginibacter polytrichastri]|nr:mechanosensitive ion channel [Mucilaginibacter polytrichastri]